MERQVHYRTQDGVEVALPLVLDAWVLVPRDLVAREPGLCWAAEYEDAPYLSHDVMAAIRQITLGGRPLDPGRGALVVPVAAWSRRTGGLPSRAAVAPAAELSARRWDRWIRRDPAGRTGAQPLRAHGRARTLALARPRPLLGAVARVAQVDVFDLAGWVTQLILAALSALVLAASVGFAWSRLTGDGAAPTSNAILLVVSALVVGGVSQRLRHGRDGALAPATLANGLALVALSTVVVGLGVSLLGG